MTTIASIPSYPAAQPAVPTTTVVSGSGALAQTAASLAAESSVVSLLGGAPSVDAVGLYDTLATAGTTVSQSTPPVTEPSLDQAIVGSLFGAGAATQTLDALAATVPTASFDANAAFANFLPTNPTLAYTVIADSFDQGVVSTISTFA